MQTLPKKFSHLKARPTDIDLLSVVEETLATKEQVCNYVWTGPSEEKFILSVRSTGNDDELEWQLLKGSESESDVETLWSVLTSDATDIYTKIIKSTGEDLEAAVKNDLKSTRPKMMKPLPQANKELDDALKTTFEGNKKQISSDLEKLRAEQESALSGELALVHISNVLQSIALAKVSGRLSIDSKEKQIDIFFEGGAPVHAISNIGEGRECMLRTINLEEGRFHFDLAMRTEVRTISESLESLILAAAKLADNQKFLDELGVVNESILTRRNRNLSEAEFENSVGANRPDMTSLKSFYLVIDGTTALKDIVRRGGFQRSRWLESAATLIRARIIGIRQDFDATCRKELDPEILESFKTTITNPQTGLVTYPAFLFMLYYEVVRADDDRHLSLMLFDYLSKNEDKVLSTQVLEPIVWLINEIKRPIDIVAHYEEHGLAIMLPNMKSRAAVFFAERIAERIGSDPRLLSVETKNISASFGVATVPSDVDDVLSLLTAAELACAEARKRNAHVASAQDLARPR